MKVVELLGMNENPIAAGPSLSFHIDTWAKNNMHLLNTAKPMGQIENFTVRTVNGMYGLFDDKTCIALLNTKKYDSFTMLDPVWVDSQYRKQRVLSKLIWFLHSRENIGPMGLGQVHSTDTMDVLRVGGFKQFQNKRWFNMSSQETAAFDPSQIDKYYRGHGADKWIVILEGWSVGPWPKFPTENNWIIENYDWPLE